MVNNSAFFHGCPWHQKIKKAILPSGFTHKNYNIIRNVGLIMCNAEANQLSWSQST